MRWSNLTIAADEQARLPGYRDEAVVRRFDAPEALETRFYEVRAKSALNRVPEASQVPFRWTINPYRGCSHACTYCLAGETPILLADGRTKPMAQLRVGDRIVGTQVDEGSRRYVETEVLDVWSSIKPAYRTTLADATELISSGDHRFLTNRGWKHVVGAQQGPDRRPHLTTANRLLGTGRFPVAPEHDTDYRLGYLCGVARGDAELAFADGEAVERTRAFLEQAGLATDRLRYAGEIGPGVAPRRAAVARVREFVRLPMWPNDQWRKGFLAGVFDTRGRARTQALQVTTNDRQLVRLTLACLRHFGFTVDEEAAPHRPGVAFLHLRGGLRESMRFLHLCDPAITRKRRVQGAEVTAGKHTQVISVEALGVAMRLYDITTGTGDFIADGVVSHNCFARPTHTYLDFDAGRDFEKEIVVKVNVPEVLRVELARKSWKGEHVALGTNTDPYQWVEGRYKLMRGIWEAMRDFANPCSILTKSPLLLRDLDLMKEIAAVTTISANLSIPTMEEKAWRATEPHTPNPKARMEAVAELNRQGIPCGILVAPLMPGINDSPKQVERILAMAAEAGATGVGGIALHLRPGVKEVFMDWLRSYRPELVPRYEELYGGRRSYAPKDERERLARVLRRGKDAVERETGVRPGRRHATWPADLRNAAKDTESVGPVVRQRPAGQPVRRAVTRKPGPSGRPGGTPAVNPEQGALF